MSKENYLKELFIDEAKPALQRHSGGGGGSGSSDLIECESLPTEGVQADKIYRARWRETVEVPESVEIWVTVGDGTPALNYNEVAASQGFPIVMVNSFSEIPWDEDVPTLYVCLDEGMAYPSTRPGGALGYVSGGEDVGYIDDPSELDVNSMQFGIVKIGIAPVTTNHEQIGIPGSDGSDASLVTYADGVWRKTSSLYDFINARGAMGLLSGVQERTVDHLISYNDTSNTRDMSDMFAGNELLLRAPLLDTRNVTGMTYMFYYCTSLITVPSLDMRNVTYADSMFDECTSLAQCWIKNIKCDLQVGSGGKWGHLLTVKSLTHLIYELRDTGSMLTLTVGTANLAKLANVYVKTVGITDEMRVEDDLVDEKMPFVVCESTDEGAMLITDYANFKNWQIA